MNVYNKFEAQSWHTLLELPWKEAVVCRLIERLSGITYWDLEKKHGRVAVSALRCSQLRLTFGSWDETCAFWRCSKVSTVESLFLLSEYTFLVTSYTSQPQGILAFNGYWHTVRANRWDGINMGHLCLWASLMARATMSTNKLLQINVNCI